MVAAQVEEAKIDAGCEDGNVFDKVI